MRRNEFSAYDTISVRLLIAFALVFHFQVGVQFAVVLDGLARIRAANVKPLREREKREPIVSA